MACALFAVLSVIKFQFCSGGRRRKKENEEEEIKKTKKQKNKKIYVSSNNVRTLRFQYSAQRQALSGWIVFLGSSWMFENGKRKTKMTEKQKVSENFKLSFFPNPNLWKLNTLSHFSLSKLSVCAVIQSKVQSIKLRVESFGRYKDIGSGITASPTPGDIELIESPL